MADSVEVRPRYKDPDVMQQEMQTDRPAQSESAISAATSVTKGIFTSMYENKIIVLIIIIVIIIIGIIAYIVYRKPEELTDKPKPTVKSPESMQTVKTEQPVQTDEKANLLNLLARSKKQDIKVEEPVVSKTTDEIMQLMEDNPIIEITEDNIEQSDPEVEDESDTIDENHLIDDTSDDTINKNGLCNTIVPPGRQCRNKARTNGKCQRHSG